MFPALEGRFLTNGPPGKSSASVLMGQNSSYRDTDDIEKDPIERGESHNRWSKGYSLMRIREQGRMESKAGGTQPQRGERHRCSCNRKEGDNDRFVCLMVAGEGSSHHITATFQIK